MDVAPFKVRVARGVCNLHRRHACQTFGHQLRVLTGGLRLVEAQHRRDALRNGFGGYNHDFTRRQLLRRLRRHNDVLVVGEHKDNLCRGLLDGMKNVLGRGVHGLSALNDAVGAEIAEHTGKTFSRADGDKAEGLFRRGGRGLCGVTCFELLLDGV